MMLATLQIEDLGSGLKRYTVDCPHGTTTGHSVNGAKIGEAVIIAGVVLKHYSEEGCRCTQELRRRYPASLLDKALWVKVD